MSSSARSTQNLKADPLSSGDDDFLNSLSSEGDWSGTDLGNNSNNSSEKKSSHQFVMLDPNDLSPYVEDPFQSPEAAAAGTGQGSTADTKGTVNKWGRKTWTPQRLKVTSQDLGRPDGLRHTILTLLVQEHYQRAANQMQEYMDSKNEYPLFYERAGRFVKYAIDLINAIKAKRSFPGMQHLPAAKQRDLFDKAQNHFRELVHVLKKIEKIDKDVRAEDVRSTVWVVKALVYSTFVIFLMLFLREVSRGIIPSIIHVTDDSLNRFTDWTFERLF